MAKKGDFQVGQRVEVHPATASWRRGDKYGTIEVFPERGRWVHVRMERSGYVIPFTLDSITPAA